MKLKNILAFSILLCTIFLIAASVSAEEQNNINLELKYLDIQKNLCDSFYTQKDVKIHLQDLKQFWQTLSEGKGNFIWYYSFIADDNSAKYLYPKLIATIPVDWVWKGSPLYELGGGSFNCVYSSNTLEKSWVGNFYTDEVAKTYIKVVIKKFDSKNDSAKYRLIYEDDMDYTRAGNNIGEYYADKFTRFQSNIMDHTNIRNVVYLIDMYPFIYEIRLETQFDNRYSIDMVPIEKELNSIVKSIVIIAD